MTPARTGPLLTKIPALICALALVVFAALSMSTNSATRFYQWPWFFYWQVLVIAPIAILAGRLLLRGRLVRFGWWLDCGLVLLAATNVIAALASPFPSQSLNLALIPVAGVCLAYLGLDWIEREASRRPGSNESRPHSQTEMSSDDRCRSLLAHSTSSSVRQAQDDPERESNGSGSRACRGTDDPNLEIASKLAPTICTGRARRTALVARIVGALMLLFVVTSFCLWLFARVLPVWLAGTPLAAALRIRNAEPFGHSLYTAGAAVLSAPWLAALGLTGSRRMRGIWLFAAALALVLVPTTASRGGVLALITMLACTAAIRTSQSSLARRRRLLVATCALLAAAVVAGLDPRLRALALRGQWSSAATDSNRQHSAMLQAGWLMGCARPIAGYGPGTVSRVYPHYRERLAGGVDDVLQLHNVPAQLWAELGAPGIVAMFLLLIGVIRLARGGWVATSLAARRGMGILPRSDGSPPTTGGPTVSLPADHLRAQAALIAIAGYAVMSLFDYQLDVPWFVATAAALLVMLRVRSPDFAPPNGVSRNYAFEPRPQCRSLLARSTSPSVRRVRQAHRRQAQDDSERESNGSGPRTCRGAGDLPSVLASKLAPTPAMFRLTGALLLACLAAMVWPTVLDLRARQLFAKAADARQAGNDAAFIAGAERAAVLSPGEPFYLTQLAAFYAEQYLQAGDIADRDRARERCSNSLRRALAIDPDQDYCQFNLGWLLLPQQPAEAEKHFSASARLSPYRGGVYLGVGLSLLGRNEDAAATAFALEWLNDPHTLASPLWDGPPLSAFRVKAAEALQRLAARWLEQDALPASDRDRIRYVAALAGWWLGRSTDITVLLRCGSPEQRHFFQNLDAIERRSYAPSNAGAPEPWESLYLAWRGPAMPADLDADQPEFAAALRHRTSECHTSFTRLLTQPTAPDAALMRLARNERPGYSVLMRNQDGFPVRDLYIFQENLLVKEHLSFLFPQKGYLPDRLLLAALRDLTSAPR